MIKALGLFSGGLDSILAVKLIEKQGIKVELVCFTTPFFKPKNAIEMAKKIKIPLKTFDITKKFLKILRNPKHGYGSGMNPCIDCKILMLKIAKKYAKKINTKFIFTGEVLGERPMSQNKKALELIEKKVGLKGKLLRPLSAKLLPITEAEKKWVDREKMLDIKGRKRDKQIKLAEKFKIKKYPSPSGGCLLTYKEYSRKIKDLLKHKKRLNKKDIDLLKVGRHFRFKNNKIIVGRNEEENKILLKIKTDYVFEVPNCGSPITILQGPKTKESIKLAAELTAKYSDSKEKITPVKYDKKMVMVSKIRESKIKNLRI